MDRTYSKYFTYIKPVLRSKDVQTYSSLVFSLIAITIFAVFAIRPTVGTIVSLQKTIKEQQDLLQRLETKSQNLSQGKNNLENMGSDQKSKIYTLIPNSTSIPCLIDNLNYIATSNNVEVYGLQFQPILLEGRSKCVFTDNDLTNITKKAVVKEVEFTINAQGAYQNLVHFITSMNQMSRLVTIKNINLNKQSEGPLIMSINAKAYYFTDQ